MFAGYVYVGEQDPDAVFWQGGAEWQETARHGETPRGVRVCAFPVCVLRFSELLLHTLKNPTYASQHTFPQPNKQWCVSPH